MSLRTSILNRVLRNSIPGAKRGVLPGLAWLAGAAVAGTLVLGCVHAPNPDPRGGPGAGASPQLLAIATGGKIQLYTVNASLAASGSSPTPIQTITAPDVQSVAIDEKGNMFYLANTGAAGSDASFYSCPAPKAGGSFTCSKVGGTISGAQWLAVDPGDKVFVTAAGATAGAVLSFDAATGPGAATKQVYTSAHPPITFGGLAVDGSDTLYVSELKSTFGGGSLYSCSTACWLTAGSQTDITTTVTSQVPNSAIGGPLAINFADGITLYVGSANASTSSPETLPVSLTCTQGTTPALVCTGASATFVMDHGGEINTFDSTVGIAADSDGYTFVPVLLNNFGDTSAVLGPSFFGFLPSGAQFDCSFTPANCPVNLLPSVPDNSTRNAIPYGIAIGLKTS